MEKRASFRGLDTRREAVRNTEANVHIAHTRGRPPSRAIKYISRRHPLPLAAAAHRMGELPRAAQLRRGVYRCRQPIQEVLATTAAAAAAAAPPAASASDAASGRRSHSTMVKVRTARDRTQ